jgi:hypothetical protein
MDMREEWTFDQDGRSRRIELFHGDILQLTPRDEIDVLVVSAFPNDYSPTPRSLIGALATEGISVSQLARSKEADLREDFSCWLSRPVRLRERALRILCIESGWRGSPPEIADDLFRALATTPILGFENASVAMPLIGAGDQGYSPALMMTSILKSAVGWFRRGLALKKLRIVVKSRDAAEAAAVAFAKAKRDDDEAGILLAGIYDVFISYCRENRSTAREAHDRLLTAKPGLRVFCDERSVQTGSSWLIEIAEALDNSRRVMALYTPEYWASGYCKDEFVAAYTRQKETATPVLYPLYIRSAKIPYLFRTVQHEDCREADSAKMASACDSLCQSL